MLFTLPENGIHCYLPVVRTHRGKGLADEFLETKTGGHAEQLSFWISHFSWKKGSHPGLFWASALEMPVYKMKMINSHVLLQWISVNKYFLYIFTTVYIFIGNFIEVFLGNVHFILYGKCMIPLMCIYVSTNHWVTVLCPQSAFTLCMNFIAPAAPLGYSCWNIRVTRREEEPHLPRWAASNSSFTYTVHGNIKYYRQVLLLCFLWLMFFILHKLLLSLFGAGSWRRLQYFLSCVQGWIWQVELSWAPGQQGNGEKSSGGLFWHGHVMLLCCWNCPSPSPGAG